MNEQDQDLKRFSEMEDVEVADDDQDVRGWEVTTPDGRDVGEVRDLLVDTKTMKVRGLEVELEGSRFNWTDNRRVVVPVDSVRVNADEDQVVISGMRMEEIGSLRSYGSEWAGEAGGYATDSRIPGERGHAETGAGGYERPTGQLPGERDRIAGSGEDLDIGDGPTGEVRGGKHRGGSPRRPKGGL